MATQSAGFILSHHTTLCPPPLHVTKKPRKAPFRRRILRKSTHIQHSSSDVYGPLDDIIDEIKGNIWDSPLDCNLESSFLDWGYPLKASSTWTVTPLPVSRIPSDQPLTIRKNRGSRSTASESSVGDPMTSSKNTNRGISASSDVVSSLASSETIPWPTFNEGILNADGYEPTSSSTTLCTDHTAAQQALENIIHNANSTSQNATRRPSRLRVFTSGLARLRRTDTGDTISSNGSPTTSSPTASSFRMTQEGGDGEMADIDDKWFEAYLERNKHNGTKLLSIVNSITDMTMSQPSTLKVAINIIPEVNLLQEQELQDFWVAIEIEGQLHETGVLPYANIDVIFIVDNGYYVTKDCLAQALDAIEESMRHLIRGDRIAFYTTHCTHQSVTGTVPDMLYPLRPFSQDSHEIFRDLIADVLKYGTQAMDPPRPNPTMTEVINAIAKSLEIQEGKSAQTHIILLSPVTSSHHAMSEAHKGLRIYQVNPAVLPFQKDPGVQLGGGCVDACHKQPFMDYWGYQYAPSRIERILHYARLPKSVGEIGWVHVDIRPNEGCEVLEYNGSTDISCLSLGEVYTFFVRIRVTRSETEEVDLSSSDRFLNSSLDAKNLRQDLHNIKAAGATQAYLFSVQVMSQSSLHAADDWFFHEHPLLVFRDLGNLMRPCDTAIEVYRRLFFHKLSQLDPDLAAKEVDKLAATIPAQKEIVMKLIERMTKEIDQHRIIREYEKIHRKKLPIVPGPISIPAAPHEWLMEKLNQKKNKRKGRTFL